MKLTTCAVVAAVITILFVTFGAHANSDQDPDPVVSIPTEPVAQALPQEPPAQTPPQPIEAEPESSLWVSYTKNHGPIQTLLLFTTAVGSLIFAERRLRIARQDAISRDTDALWRRLQKIIPATDGKLFTYFALMFANTPINIGTRTTLRGVMGPLLGRIFKGFLMSSATTVAPIG